MAFEDHARIFIDIVTNLGNVEKVSQTLNRLEKNLGSMGKAFSRVGTELKKSGLSSSAVRSSLKSLGDNMDQLGLTVSASGKSFVNAQGKVIGISKVADMAMQSVGGFSKQMKFAEGTAEQYDAAFSQLRGTMLRMGKTTRFVDQSLSNFRGALADNNLGVNTMGKFADKTSGKVQSFGSVAQKASRYSMREFKGEMLSIMFIAQGMAQTFSNMINPVLEMTGVFDVWKATLISVLGPVLIPFSMFLIKIMTGFMKLSPEAKKVIGIFVLLMGILLPIVATVATFAIAAGALGISLGAFALIVGGVIAVVAGLSAIFGGLSTLWELITGKVKEAHEWFMKFWGAIKWIALGVAIIAGVIAAAFSAPVAVVVAVVAAIVAAFSWLFQFLEERFQIFSKVWNGIKGAAKKVGEFFGGLFGGKNNKVEMTGDVPKMAAGGIVTRPTMAVVGEAGPEAIVPLDQMGGMGANIDYAPQINVYANGLGGADIDRIVRMVNERLFTELRRLGIR